MALQLRDDEWQTLRAIGNSLIPALNASGNALKPKFEQVIQSATSEAIVKLRLMLLVLSYRGPAFAFTRSTQVLSEMSPADARAVLINFRDSRIPALRMFFYGISSMSGLVWALSDEGKKRIGYVDPHPALVELKAGPASWAPPLPSLPAPVRADSPILLSTDVVIVGSGSSSMVAAYLLSKQGYRVLILEKGTMVSGQDSPLSDVERDALAFEGGGQIASSDSSIFMLAGATVGGGGAVNWSCALRTPEAIRDEWVSRGAPLYGEKAFSEAMDEVERVMRVSVGVEAGHSFTNRLLLESATALGYPAKVTGQNTGTHSPNSGFIEFGQRCGELAGGVAEWFRYATDHGAEIVPSCQVVRIRHNNGHASGVDALVDGKPLVVNARRVVVACGSLQTPLLLKRSGFKNKHIGQGLKLHPVTLAFGDFEEVVNRRDDPIMTAVSTQSDNLDGKSHGPKLEAIHHRPHLLTGFMPYRSADDWLAKADRYEHTSAILVITRDKGRGSVRADSKNPFKVAVDYTTSDYDLWALHEGSITAANMLYVGGAQRIYLSSTSIPDFVSTKPKSERTIWDREYREWVEKARSYPFKVYDTRVGSAHQMSSCRMNNRGPKHGAVDGTGHLYECDNVHVIDASVFPSASGVNPMISCMSTSYALTSYLLNDLEKSNTKL